MCSNSHVRVLISEVLYASGRRVIEAWFGKRVQNVDGGDVDHFGGDDLDKVSALFSGDSNVDVLDINSVARFRNLMFRLRDPLDTFSYIFRGGAITQNVDAILPPLASSDTLVFNNHPAVLTNKTISSTNNNISGFAVMPEVKKTGTLMCGGTPGAGSGSGLLYGHVDLPDIAVRNIEAPPTGTYWRYNTGTVVDTLAGIRWPQTITRKEFNPRFKVRCRLPATTGLAQTRFYVGLSTDVVIEPDDVPFSTTEAGIFFGWTSAQTTYHIFRNGGVNTASATMIDTNTSIARTNAWRTFEIQYIDGGATAICTIGNPTVTPEEVIYQTTFTTNLTPSGFSMAPTILISNSSTAARDFDIGYVQIEQDV